MNAIDQVRRLGGTITPTDNTQRWMHHKAEILGVATGWGAERDEAAENLLKRLPRSKPVQCALPLPELSEIAPVNIEPLWRRLLPLRKRGH